MATLLKYCFCFIALVVIYIFVSEVLEVSPTQKQVKLEPDGEKVIAEALKKQNIKL